jgi:hypothetical protein
LGREFQRQNDLQRGGNASLNRWTKWSVGSSCRSWVFHRARSRTITLSGGSRRHRGEHKIEVLRKNWADPRIVVKRRGNAAEMRAVALRR